MPVSSGTILAGLRMSFADLRGKNNYFILPCQMLNIKVACFKGIVHQGKVKLVD